MKINVAIYRIQKWGQNLQKMGSGYQHFHPKIDSAPLKTKKIIFSNIGFIVFKRTVFATLPRYPPRSAKY